MKIKLKEFIFLCLGLLQSYLVVAQQDDIRYLSSGAKLSLAQSNMDIRHYTIKLTVDIQHRSIGGSAEIDMNLSKPSDSIILDLIHFYKISSVAVDGKSISFVHAKDKIFIGANAPFAEGHHAVRVTYAGKPPVAVRPPWLGGFTWEKDRSGNEWISINCQKEGGRVYFPCKDHPSDEPNEGVDMYITIPKDLVVAGPGLLKGTVVKSGLKTYHWQTNYTISNYCILFNIGKYKVYTDSYTTVNGNKVPVEFYVLEEDTAHARKLIQTKIRDTRILEKYFGEYPWAKEKIGIAEVPNSGMEHQT